MERLPYRRSVTEFQVVSGLCAIDICIHIELAVDWEKNQEICYRFHNMIIIIYQNICAIRGIDQCEHILNGNKANLRRRQTISGQDGIARSCSTDSPMHGWRQQPAEFKLEIAHFFTQSQIYDDMNEMSDAIKYDLKFTFKCRCWFRSELCTFSVLSAADKHTHKIYIGSSREEKNIFGTGSIKCWTYPTPPHRVKMDMSMQNISGYFIYKSSTFISRD